jgi:hypothetical protein
MRQHQSSIVPYALALLRLLVGFVSVCIVGTYMQEENRQRNRTDMYHTIWYVDTYIPPLSKNWLSRSVLSPAWQCNFFVSTCLLC